MGVIDHPTSHNVSALAWNPKGIQFTVFSPCGEYLAESTVAGQIAVWEVRSGACMGVIDHPTSHNVSALAWNPKGIQFTVFSPCGEYLAESTVAGQIAVWEVRSGACMGVIDHPTSHNVSALAWNPKGIQFTVFSPCGEYLAESTVAGQIAVWEVRFGACMGIIDHPTSHNVSALAWNPKGIQFTVFSPCGEYLAESTVAGQIAVWEVRSGACMGVIDHPTSHNVSALAWNPKGIQFTVFSPCGEYLAGSTVAGQIAVWEVRSGACMGIVDHPTSHNVSALPWNPKVAGQIAVWEVRSGACMGVIDHPTSCVSALAWNPKGIQFTVFSPCGEYLAGSTVAGQIAVWEVRSGACMGIVNHPTSHNVSALAWNPKGNGVLAYCDVAGQLGTLVNCYGKDSTKFGADSEDVEMVEREADNDDLIDNIIENYESDDEAISIERIKNETLGLRDNESGPSRPASRATLVPAAAPRAPPQPPFQSSATPAHLEHRYMCWNEVGIVRCHSVEDGESTVDVEFHDTTFHHGIHLNNYLNHTMASLSSSVLALACETPSKLVCISLVGSSKEWSVSLPDTEEVLCVSAAAGIVAIATNARLLRLFTPMGTQRQVISLPGPVVTLASFNTTVLAVISLPGPVVTLASFNTTVLAVYHSSEPGDNDQHLAMDIIALNGRQVRSKTVPLPLTPGSKLTWLGTSDCGSPCAYDTSGILRLHDVSSGIWMPIIDANANARGASDSWFIVSVSEPAQRVRAILCRGTSFPVTAPKPIITELPLQIPVCELDTEKGQYEEQLVRWAHSTADVDVKTARETALKLFALACRSEIEQRALELMEILKDDRLLPLAAKYASRLGRVHLADKLTDLAHEWERDGNTAHNNAQFEALSATETYDVTSEDLNQSLIIPQRAKERKEAVNNIKPVPIKSSPGGARNPFKKQHEATKTGPSPLSLTDRNFVETPATEENHDPIKPNEGEKFTDWFARNKTSLEQENPTLSPSELTKQAIKTYKTLQTKLASIENGDKIQNGDSNKRKIEEVNDSPVASAPKQSKLSAFAFSKKT
ncbi:hypothetical protein O0L34_g9942 [Tuta absoluta]|nr:hypothetical protein O0L34_g9942 [Tuta absoluta]